MSNWLDLKNTPNVPKATQALEEALAGVTDASNLREIMLQTLQKQGVIVRSRDTEFHPELIVPQPSEPPPAVAMPASPDTCIRVVYPGGNTRCEIYGTSEEALDAQETKLRAMFGQR